jgi:hypothetical protein
MADSQISQDTRAYQNASFRISILASFAAWTIVVALFVWRPLIAAPPRTALMALLVPHMFRFVGMSFLVAGVVSQPLPKGFALPAAYGDLIAAFLAMAAALALAASAPFALGLVWVFNVWGALDLINAIYQGQRRVPVPGSLGAAFYIPTLIVPGLLVGHALIFRLLLR